MEIVSTVSDKMRQQATALVEVENFLSRTERLIECKELKTPYDWSIRWALQVEPNFLYRNRGKYCRFVSVYLCNPSAKSNNVHATLRCVIVNQEGAQVGAMESTYLHDYSTIGPGQGFGLLLIKRDEVVKHLSNGSLLLKCFVNIAERVTFAVGAGEQEKTVHLSCPLKDFIWRKCDIVSEDIASPFDQDIRWKIGIHPYGCWENEGFVSLFLCKANATNNALASSDWFVSDRNGKTLHHQKFKEEVDFSEYLVDQGSGWRKFMLHRKIEEMLGNNDFFLKGTIKYVLPTNVPVKKETLQLPQFEDNWKSTTFMLTPHLETVIKKINIKHEALKVAYNSDEGTAISQKSAASISGDCKTPEVARSSIWQMFW